MTADTLGCRYSDPCDGDDLALLQRQGLTLRAKYRKTERAQWPFQIAFSGLQKGYAPTLILCSFPVKFDSISFACSVGSSCSRTTAAGPGLLPLLDERRALLAGGMAQMSRIVVGDVCVMLSL